MIGNFIALYRARKDPNLAKRLAGEMIVDGAIEKAGWPLTIAKFWMALGIGVMALLILAFLMIGTATHWTLAIPVLPLGATIYGLIRVWGGIDAGVGYVTQLAKTELGNRAAALKMPPRQSK